MHESDALAPDEVDCLAAIASHILTHVPVQKAVVVQIMRQPLEIDDDVCRARIQDGRTIHDLRHAPALLEKQKVAYDTFNQNGCRMVIVIERRDAKIVFALRMADRSEYGDGQWCIRTPTHVQHMIGPMWMITLHWNDGGCCT
eukprot:7385280-Prymnesium_polylepis.1